MTHLPLNWSRFIFLTSLLWKASAWNLGAGSFISRIWGSMLLVVSRDI